MLKRYLGLILLIFIVLLAFVALASQPQTVLEKEPVLKTAAIGDFGTDTAAEAAVANMIKSWGPDLIITTGDNNYTQGSADTIDQNIGKYFSDYIYPYYGSYGKGGLTNKFFPSLGNHDWNTPNAQPYIGYFTLPGNEYYYDFVVGNVHFFALDSNLQDSDGIGSDSIQAQWLKTKLQNSTQSWQIVYFHHPPYSSDATHGSSGVMQWPFASWGVDAVFSGHAHVYERIIRDGIVYFVNGLGGGEKYLFADTPVAGSVARYNSDFGAQLITSTKCNMRFEFYSISQPSQVVDDYAIKRC